MKDKKFVFPNMECKFSIQVVGEETGINWAGDFVYKRPTLQERAMIDAMRARLGNDLRTLDPDVVAFNESLSCLRFTLKEYPTWWKETDMGGSLYDGNVILEVYAKCMEFEANWKTKIHSGNPDDVSKDQPTI